MVFFEEMSLGDTDTTKRLVELLEANNPSHRTEDQVSDAELVFARAILLICLANSRHGGKRLAASPSIAHGMSKAKEMDSDGRATELEVELHRRKLLDAIDMQSEQTAATFPLQSKKVPVWIVRHSSKRAGEMKCGFAHELDVEKQVIGNQCLWVKFGRIHYSRPITFLVL